MDYINILKLIKDEILSFYTNFDVRIAYDEGDINSSYIKPLIVLDAEYEEYEEKRRVKIKASLIANSEYNLLSDEAAGILSFILDSVKNYFPVLTSVSLSNTENVSSGRFKKRVLEVTASPFLQEEATINGNTVSIGALSVIKENETRCIWQMCDENPVAYEVSKCRNVGIIKNCSFKRDDLCGNFNIKYKDMLLNNCTLIYAKGDDYIQEAKFYIGNIE